MPVLKMSHPNNEAGIPLLTSAVSNDDIRKQASKLGYENDRLKRVLDTQITSVESLMHSNTHLRAERERFVKEVAKCKSEMKSMESEYERVLFKHDALTQTYASRLNALESNVTAANAQVYALQSMMECKDAKLLAKDVYINELERKQHLLKLRLLDEIKKAKAKQEKPNTSNAAELLALMNKLLNALKIRLQTVHKAIVGFDFRGTVLPKWNMKLPTFGGGKNIEAADWDVYYDVEGADTVVTEHSKENVEAFEVEVADTPAPAEMLKNKFESLAGELKVRAEKRKIEALKRRRSKLWNSNQAVGIVSAWKKIDVVDFSGVIKS